MVKIIDFGLARLRQTGKAGVDVTIKVEPGTVWGTVDYIAPEQAQDIHAADIRADLYSLGCTFYYALTGHVPFAGRNELEKLLKHQLEEAPLMVRLRPEIPTALAAIIERLMAKDRTKRFQTPAELIQELNGACATRVSGIRTTDRAVDTVGKLPAAGKDKFKKPAACFEAEGQGTVDELLRSTVPVLPIDDAVLENWQRWTAIIEAFARHRDNRRKINAQSYDELRQNLLQECEAQASIAAGVRREFFLNLAEMVKPWLSPDTLWRTERELLYSLLTHCRQAEQGLLAMMASQDTSADGQTLLGKILDLFKRRPYSP